MSEILKNVPTDEVVAALYNDLRSRVEAVEPNDAMVAPDYADLTLPILVGTRCTHNRGLYKCNTQINSSEAWTAAHWDEITVGSELDTVNSQVIVSASQPQESNNKLWIKNGSGDEYTVPTYAEHQELLTAIQGKYTKPSGGIPATDLEQAVQTSLGNADTAYQKPSGGIPASDIADDVIPVVDNALSDSSENAVQNKVVKGALDTKAPVIINTATGNPAAFNDGGGMPIKSLLIQFTPKQTGSGDPSPSNIRPIVPWDGLTVWRGGKNLLGYEIGATKRSNGVAYAVLQNHGVSCKGTADGGTSYGIDSKGVQLKTGKYAFSVTGAVNMRTVFVKDNAYWFEINGSGSSVKNLTADATVCCYMLVANGTEVDETVYVQIEVGETATTYEEYKPITETDISFPSPVYGGELDVVSGVLTVEWGLVALDTIRFYAVREGFFASYVNVPEYSDRTKFVCNAYKVVSLTYWDNMQDGQIMGITPGNTIRIKDESVSNETELYAKLTEIGAVLAYPLATPQEIQLTPAQITALVGNNTLWSDADGSMTAVFLKKG